MNTIKIIDRIYGEEEIAENVLIDLINSRAVQRLKGISQLGMPDEYYYTKGYSRYEHSIGVLILLRRLKANLNEQIAGLLHDVSHTAFSHVVDWVIGDPTKEDYQDKSHKEIIKNSDIPQILEKYGLDYNNFVELDRFSLLESHAPALCADRIDYALREMIDFEGREKIDFLVKNLIVHNRKVVFKSMESAELFALGYEKLQREHWGGERARTRYHLLAGILKEAIEKKLISLDDLKKTDLEILNILNRSEDAEISSGLDLLRNGYTIKDSNDKDSILLKKKFRFVDPDVLVDSNLKRLSEISSEYKFILENAKKYNETEKGIKILPKT